MAFEPINYAIDVKSPFEAAAQGYATGAAIRDDQFKQQQQALQLQQQQAAMEQARLQQQTLQALAANPNPTAADYGRASLLIPGMREQLKQAWEMHNSDQQQSLLSHTSQVYGALSSGRPDVAQQLLTDRATALTNSGNKGEASQMSQLAQMVQQDPAQARTFIGLTLSALPGGDKIISGASTLGAEQRAQDKAPVELREAKAKATTAEAEANNAPKYQAAKTDEAVAKAATAQNEANYAPAKSKAELAKYAAELGLTKAQTNQAMALTGKYGAETQKAILEMAGGAMDPQKQFDAERNLRKEYVENTKGFTDVAEAYRRIKSASNNAAGDISLIYGYMKMLDPGSVVREGEFATAQNAAGVPERVLNVYNRVISGQRLSDAQRASFSGEAGGLYAAAKKREGEVRAGLDKVVKSYKLNPDNVFGVAMQDDRPAPSSSDYGTPGAGKPQKTPGGATVSNW